MPARGDLSARAEGRRPKASQKGTRGGIIEQNDHAAPRLSLSDNQWRLIDATTRFAAEDGFVFLS